MGEDDRYSRLNALNEFGIVKDFKEIKKESILIVGLGGVGSVASEMLCRCGVGKLILYDYDYIENANMNKLFYIPQQIGLSKVSAAKETLSNINSNVLIDIHNINIVTNYNQLFNTIKYGGIDNKSKISLLLCCVDNYSARITINSVCNELNIVWMNAGVSEDAMNTQIQTFIPGYIGCFQCSPPYIIAIQGDENKIKRNNVCTASLPTTMTIAASLLIHNALKYLLHFGNISFFLGYNSMQNFFPSYIIAPNPECIDKFCLQRQNDVLRKGGEEYRIKYLQQFNIYDELQKKYAQEEEQNQINMHEDNVYGIICHNKEEEEKKQEKEEKKQEKEEKKQEKEEKQEEQKQEEQKKNSDFVIEESIDELMNQFKQLQT